MVKRVIHPARAKLVGAMKNLHTANAQVGYFQEQGQHSSGFSYSALMYLHEVIGVQQLQVKYIVGCLKLL